MLELNDVSHVHGNGTRALDHVTLSIPRASDPGEGFASPEGGVDDVYLSTLAQARRAA